MAPDKAELTNMINGIVNQIVADWGMEATVHNDVRLIGDLGFTSMDVIDLLASIETQLRRKLPYERLVVLTGGGYRQELTVEEIVAFVQANYEASRAAPGAV